MLDPASSTSPRGSARFFVVPRLPLASGSGQDGCVRTYVAVVGPGELATDAEVVAAREVGTLLAQAGCVVVTGGLGGVMAAAVDGAASVGGLTLGLLPDADQSRAHHALTLSIPTGMGEMRNALIVRTCHGVLAVGGSWGTLSEIALAMRAGVPVVQVGGWDLQPYGEITRYADAAAAVTALLARLRSAPPRSP